MILNLNQSTTCKAFAKQTNKSKMCQQHDLFCYESISSDIDFPDDDPDDVFFDQLFDIDSDDSDLWEVERVDDDIMESDGFSAFDDVRPVWLDQTGFDYRNFYLHALLTRYEQFIINHYFNHLVVCVRFSFPDADACTELLEWIVQYLGSYNLYPELSFTGLDTVTSINVRWLGGCLADVIYNDDGLLTNDVVCYLHQYFC